MDNSILSDTDFHRLRNFIEKSCGISLGDDKAYLVESRLAGLMAETGCTSFSELYEKATVDRTLGLRDKIVDAMTTNETLWFRDSYPFQILEEILLKGFVEKLGNGEKQSIRIWCAGCSTGQEPYSISMVIHEYACKRSVLPLQHTEILATDISPSALFLSMAGRYDQLAISRGLPEAMRDRYFNLNGRAWVLNDKIKKLVKFKKTNLQENFAHWGKFDIIFCRYVAIYFSETFKKDLFARIADLLRPDGYLFLGGSESIHGYSNKYKMLTHNGFPYYQVK